MLINITAVLQAGAFSLLALTLVGCAPSPDPIWVRQNAPAPVVASNGAEKLSLQSGHTVCLHISQGNSDRNVAFLERLYLTQALKAGGIETNIFDCETVIDLNVRFVGRASAATADQMLAAGYGSSTLPTDSVADPNIPDALGIWDALAKEVVESATDTAKLNLNVAVVDVDVGDYQARFVSRDQGEWNHDQQFYLSDSLARQIAHDLAK